MSHNENLKPKPHAFRVLFGQKPLTKFKDYRSSIKVELIKHDDPETMLKGTYDFVKATWSETGTESKGATSEDMKKAIDQMLSGKALGLGLETMNFMFRISGITRLDTHQIVRQRVGVTFSQQCTGDRMLHHNDVLVEESIARRGLISTFINATLTAKGAYAAIVDDHENTSLQAARSILPHNLETFVFMNTNLATLLFFYKKRVDDGSQTWQMNEVSRQMATEVLKVFPELKDTFEKMSKAFTFQKDAGEDRENNLSTALYVPKVDEYDYHIRDFLYPKTKEEMHYTGHLIPYQTIYYWGTDRVTEKEYNYIESRYNELDEKIKKEHWSNEDIRLAAIDLNYNIRYDLDNGKI